MGKAAAFTIGIGFTALQVGAGVWLGDPAKEGCRVAPLSVLWVAEGERCLMLS